MSERRCKLLVLGRTGQVGWELRRALAPLGEVVALGHQELDLRDFPSIRANVRALRPEIIVNAAAYTAVDGAESEVDMAFAVNARAPRVLAEEAQRLGALLVHYSTDYVFDGRKHVPYTEDDEPCPLNVYGASKLAGERAIQATVERHIILRTSWLYGLRGRNFLLAMLRLFRAEKQVRVVDDQIGAPTWCRAVAEATADLLALVVGNAKSVSQSASQNGMPSGIFHLSASGQTSWYGFAAAIRRALPATELTASVVPITTADYSARPVRPRYSVLSNDRIRNVFNVRLASWEAQLAAVLSELRSRLPVPDQT